MFRRNEIKKKLTKTNYETIYLSTMKKNWRNLIVFLMKYTVLLIAAGVFIGLFHERDGLVALGLCAGLLLILYRKRSLPAGERQIYYLGILLSAMLGSLCEYWGTSNQYWQYHDLSGGRTFPYWLPFAWASAFAFLYTIERNIIALRGFQDIASKLLITMLVSAIFPTIGEIVTIRLGVWTYYWDYQLLGVPALAIFLLMVFHTGIFFLLRYISIRKGINSPVFNTQG